MSISPSKKKVFQNLVTLNRGTNFPQIVKLNMKSMPLEKTPPWYSELPVTSNNSIAALLICIIETALERFRVVLQFVISHSVSEREWLDFGYLWLHCYAEEWEGNITITENLRQIN